MGNDTFSNVTPNWTQPSMLHKQPSLLPLGQPLGGYRRMVWTKLLARHLQT